MTLGLVLLSEFAILFFFSPDSAPKRVALADPATNVAVANTGLITTTALILNSEGDEFVYQTPSAVGTSAGEEPQQDWGAGRSGTASAPIIGSQEDIDNPYIVLASPIAPDRTADDRLSEALREFDAARNAGPEAVIRFADNTSDDVRAVIQMEVTEARTQLAGRDNLMVGSDPSVQASFRVGVNGECNCDTVQEGINAATNGSTVRVMVGTFAENIDIGVIGSGKVITIEGGYTNNCTLSGAGISTITATVAGSTIDVSGGSIVKLKNLTVSGGTLSGAGLDVLGSSQVTLDNTDLINNNGANGGGIYIGSGSQVTLTNGSLVQNNTASYAGGGASVYGRLNALDTNSDITGNSSTSDGGGVYVNGGTLYLNGADVHDNQALGASGRGGGIYATNNAVITLTNSSFIGESAPCCNTAYDGGGIYASHSTIYSLGGNSTILQNQATNNGGGLYLFDHSLFKASSGTNIGYDVQLGNGNTAVLGAGIFIDNSALDFEGRIVNNDASNSGGGLYATGSAITLTNVTIGGTGANQHNSIGATGLNGAGMYLNSNTQALLNNTTLISNTLSNSSTGYAGGIYVRDGSVLTATNSRIEQHFLPSTFDGRGAGLYLYDATVNLNNTQVLSNTVANLGGGVRLFGTSKLNLTGGSSFVNNKALNGEGGAIAAANSTEINATDVTFQSNYASTIGGAISMVGTLNILNSTFLVNTAGSHGGGLRTSGVVTVTNSTFSGNHANNNGGGIAYLGPLSLFNDTLSSNSAGLQGGNLYKEPGGSVATLKNNIVDSGSPNNCSDAVVSQGNNLESANSCGLATGVDLINVNPLLGSLQDAGGLTRVQPLLDSSPAIDAGTNTGAPTTDQRGVSRPQDGNNDGNAITDIGAYEYVYIAPPTPTPDPTAIPTVTPSSQSVYLPLILRSYSGGW